MSISETMRYESVVSRIWQFTIGIIAQSYKLDFVNFSSIFHKLFIHKLFFFCVILEFLPVALNREVVSILCVVSSGFLIAISSNEKDSPFNIYMTNNLIKEGLISCGNVSYILYLIHWPMITYCRFVKSNSEFSIFEGSTIILACFMLAIISHHLIENPLINYCNSFKKLLTVTLLLYSLTTLLLVPHFPVRLKSPAKGLATNFKSIITAEKTFIAINGSNPLPLFHGYPVSNLTFEMFRRILKFDDSLIIPDGWSTKNEIEFAQKVIYDRCNIWNYNCEDTFKKWTTVRKVSEMHFCESSLFPNGNYTALIIGNSHARCASGAIHLNPLFKKVIMMSAYGISIPVETHADSDSLLANEAMMQVVEAFKPDVVFFINYYKGEIVDIPVTGSRFEKNQNLEKRINALNCPKCHFWDYSEAFCGDNYCNPIDENTRLPSMRDQHHVGMLMLRRFKPILDKLVNIALNLTNTNK